MYQVKVTVCANWLEINSHFVPADQEFLEQHDNMYMISTTLALCEGNPLDSPQVDSPHKGPAMWNIGVLFAINLNELLNKQLSCQ